MFAALELLERGVTPVIFERGKRIDERTADVQRFILERLLNPESNIQFGEGGAGSYSDGKLFSRAKNNKYVSKALNTFIRFGAPDNIGRISKPHLGTDVLCNIARNIRNYILEQGGQIHYSSKMTDILISGAVAAGVIINGSKEYLSENIYLAIGHSARDTFELLQQKGVTLEQKPISVGVRIEHPAEIINRMRYGDKKPANAGAATYSFTYTDRKAKRGVYTFCMCPGGEIVNASSEPGLLALNGMSYSSRSGPFSNAAIIVTCNTEDYGSKSPLAGLEFQKDIERKAFIAGGATWRAPAQNLEDYLSGRCSGRLNNNSFKMGVTQADLKEIFPNFINDALHCAFAKWKQDSPRFVCSDAILLAPETRTSCPLKIMRNDNYESVNIPNLYPIGEGSGYSGGITSSAADAIKAVERSITKSQ